MLWPFGRNNVRKAIQTTKLAAILNQLPAETWVTTNQVENLVVTDKAGEELGYIDLAEDVYELFDKNKQIQ
jgi:hypothetical protein